MPEREGQTVLHFVAADADRGGILSVVRALAGAEEFGCVLGVNPGFVQTRAPRLETWEAPRMAGEVITLRNFWRARAGARAVRDWLRADRRRVYHGHSRAGMLVGLWLAWLGERRAVVSVHCYGRQRWFYRAIARRLGARLYWLSPAMRRYYGLSDRSWEQCIPSCVPAVAAGTGPRARPPPAHRLRLGGMGLIVRVKGWHLVIEALASLPPALRARVTFDHIGAPDDTAAGRSYAREVRQLARARGVESQVRWRGEELSSQALLADIDALVVATTNEALSVAMLEALAAGVPVLAADSGGPMDVLVPGRTGWFFRTGVAGDLARHLEAMLGREAWRGIRITPGDLARFEAPAVARQWSRVYRELQPEAS